MLKKILLIFLLMLFSICFAAEIPQNMKAQYKAEIETYISTELPAIKKRVDQEFWHARNMYNLYQIYKYTIDKLKYSDKLYDYMNNINTEELYFYLHLVNITNKYVKIKDNMPPTDSVWDIFDFVAPYLKSGKVNTDSIQEFSSYTAEKINKIWEYINEI